ncbi:EamA family transporter [Rhodococcus sp. IEGM 1401]|uniref:EamA family transporter n=1 Tax=unclassified Rhodococcus (in: high G+C Gram-positive bacteria) TaxID=192944 RepID=UPI0022B47250|nr:MULTISPECIES: EamA family transporter [unclassified Rhodococcus (in: high G+C Gram-positive bacteria)]MCZ4563638.1 EamA family transporter [Rhodococcus sp. IEGM 1401]MDI9923752.1 EamA family transporter [Rhodococcus sp. IEGM 1372]MDV8036245.1 EamA family transporter [Rhodococcus sp. IEGM 1414]
MQTHPTDARFLRAPDVAPSTLGLTAAAALAPILWGTTYLVTTELLPPDRPMTASVLRAVPAGLLLLLIAPGVPARGWRLKIATLGVLNIGLFFPILFVAAYRLPGGIAAVVGSAQPLVIVAISAIFGWGRTRPVQVGWAAMAVVGVALTAVSGTIRLDAIGLAAAVVGAVSMAVGVALTKRWGVPPDTSPLNSTAWQLIVGGMVISPLIPIVDDGPWALDADAAIGYAWLAVVGGALAYSLWFRGARALPSANVTLLGVLSPLTAAVIGWIVLGQSMTGVQCVGFGIALVGSIAGQFVTTHPSRSVALRYRKVPGRSS